MLFELTAIFLVMLLIFKFIRNKKVLLVILSVFLIGTIVCEILHRTLWGMGPQMLALGLQYLFVPGSLAIAVWLVVRRMQEPKQKAAER